MSSTRARTARPHSKKVNFATRSKSIVVGTIVLTLVAPIGHALAAAPGAVSTRRAVLEAEERRAELEVEEGRAELEAQQKGGYHFSRVERCLMRKINRRRANNGMRRLEWDLQIGYVGRAHANRMAAAGGIWHDDAIGQRVTHWRALGQNTGRGRGCKTLSRSFYRSPTHRSNILGHWRFIGVGARREGGRLYVQQVFESRRNPGNVYHYP